jgi:hypothetical protein
MSIQEVVITLNQMQGDGVIDCYAIGGAVGAGFYLEPAATFDMDVFITFRHDPQSLIVTLQPIYDYLATRGYSFEGEHIVIAGFPVEFFTPPSALEEEALEQAVEKDIEGVPARVFTAEHLAAITLQIGRGKDKARLVQFIEAQVLDIPRFESILSGHGLMEKWQKFQEEFLSDAS